jgi:hypothetical protein
MQLIILVPVIVAWGAALITLMDPPWQRRGRAS